MNRHQVLTGACNAGDQCYAVGSVEGIHFTAYAAGCDIVILASDFQRVQIIPGVTHGNVKVSCVDCSTDTGKIAASYQNKVYIFEPTPLLHHESTHKLDYRWYQTASFEADCYINCVSWNMEGSKILTGGEVLQIWSYIQESHDHEGGGTLGKSVRFHVGGAEDDGDTAQGNHNLHDNIDKVETTWECVWRCRPATPVYHLKYSPDGLLFASAGKTDRLVKIWYEDRKLHLPLTKADSIVSPKKEELHFSFVYIAHPRAVTGFSWRKTSKYMPRGSVANMLVTSCIDNVCRLWCETILPDDGLVDLEQFDPNASMDPKFHTHRHKKRFMQRLKTIRSAVKHAVNEYRIQRQWSPSANNDKYTVLTQENVQRHAIHKRKRHHKFGPETVMSMPNFSSVQSVHDFHKFALHHSGVAPALHFHLAASINPETDIPLLPVVGAKGDQKFNFQLHWLNNKELEFTMEAEIILQDLHRGTLSGSENTHEAPHEENHEGSDSDHGGQEVAHEENEVDGHHKKKKNKLFKKRHKHHHSKHTKDLLGHHKDSSNSIASDHSDHTSEGTGGSSNVSPEVAGSVIDALDRKIEVLLRDWHQNADMMFSIHPVDGSYLVWLVDWLDEYNPYCFRQAQVSFSSRLPHAFPVPDARTMASNLLMYCNYSKMDIKSAMRMSENRTNEAVKIQNQPAPATGKSSPGQNDNMLIPNVLLITKHLNGSLNQWQVTFADQSKFSTVVSVAHASRACGHRFRTNSATCHPKLPLLLTTSHHNIPRESSKNSPVNNGDRNFNDENMDQDGLDAGCMDDQDHENLVGGVEFCSELILWRVDPVGPLSKSGGIVELARINSPHLSAFANVAWVPTLLPSSTLGSYSNSPSALFVASDGSCLRMYQAVIDARTVLLEMGSQRKEQGTSFCSTTSSGYSVETQKPASELFNIVSLQSSSRPGCIIELEAIADAKQNWQQTQLLHVFQEQLITGKPGSGPEGMEAIVDLRNISSFSEHFYLVVLEKAKDHGSTLHMWKITISSQPGSHIDGPADTNKTYAPDVYVVEDDGSNPPSRTGTPDHFHHKPTAVVKLSFSTTKVCTQKLSLPEGVDVQCATVSAGHLSSASIYPACLAPYLLVTACSDGDVRFWRCDMASVEGIDQSGLHCDVSLFTTSFEMAVEEEDGIRRQSTVVFTKSETVNTNYSWEEWKMCNQSSNSSAINIPGHPITVSCAYSGRVAVAYRLFGIRAAPDNPTGKLVNLWVAIYECESTGGSEWLLEDTIELKNVSIPDPKAEIDLNCIFSPGGASPNHLNDDLNSPKGISPSSSLVNVNMINRTKSVPSLSTICSVRKCISEFGNKAGVLQQKHLVELDWVSTEDGSHILTVGVGSKVLMYAQVSNDIVSASKHSDSDEQDNRHSFSKTLSKGALNLHLGGERSQTATKNKAMLQHRSKSMVLDDTPEQIQWMKLRSVELTTADGLPPLPMHISWVRAGILVVGMDNEMHVYSQWRNSLTTYDHCDADDRNFDDTSLSFVSALPTIKSTSAMKPSYSMPSFKHLNSLIKKTQDGNSNLNKSKSESMSSLSAIHEYGLFEAAHEANPVLPQYHPKKLMELLNFGKIRRVKAILVHLVRCISGGDVHPVAYSEEVENDESKWGFRPRTVSVSGASPNEIPLLHEEPQPDYKELTSIPLLPIYALLAADEDTTVAKIDPISTHSQANHTANQDYSDLFSTNVGQDEELNIDVLGTSADSNRSGPRQRLPSSSAQGKNPNYFGPGHSQVLTNHLTHTRLPGLSSLDQMYLLAIADTVANIKMDFAERFEAEKSEMNGTDSSSSGNHVTETIDDCGLRFLLAIRHHIYLLRTLPPRQRAVLKKQGLKSFNLVWAFHSEATEELLSYLPNMHKGEPTWEELRQFGAGWWIRSISLLKRTVEKLAKIAFQANKDPLDAAIFYLAMRKKNVLWGLYRSIDNRRMMDFFKHDFTEERWRKAALKNAFDLLGKQRFLHAAAFFLLAGALNDAVEVCLDKLNDIQLALVICRLYDGEDIMSDSAKRILQTVILGHSDSGKNTSRSKPHPDPFLRSMALWLFKDYKMSLKTLLNSGYSGIQGPDDTDGVDSNNTTPSVFNFYNYLRTHPLLVRQRIIKAAPIVANRRKVIPGFTKQNTIVEANENTVFIDKVTPMERRLFFKTAHTHYKNGCPLLALEVLSKLPSMICEEDTDEEDSSVNPGLKPSEGCISTGQLGDFENNSSGSKCGDNSSSNGLDWGQPMTNGFGNSGSGVDSQMADAFDWGAPNTKLEDEEPNFKISDGESEESESDEKKVHFDVNGGDKKGKLEKVPPIVVDDGDISDNVNGVTKGTHTKKTDNKVQVDIFAQQYMFISCLKVLMEEMRTLATGFEVDGGQLRFQLYIWLEREVEVLRYLCHYSEDEMSREDVDQPLTSEGDLDTDPEDSSSHLEVTPPRVQRSHSVRSDVSVGTYKPTLHEVILAEKMDFEAKMERMSKRKQWLKTHSQLLRTLASYCVLQGSGGGGLASVQMELLLLLQEHQQEKPQQQLLSPLPFPTTLPLLSASIASSKTVVADPIQHISCMAQDLLHSIIEVTSPPDVTSSINTVLVMRNLSLALSACVYQCLCDCDSFVVSLNEGSDVMLEGFTSHNFTNAQAGHLMAGVQRYRRKSSAGEDIINTPPSKWPGVTSLRVLLAREKDEDAPKLHILLCETLVAVYVSLLVNAMSMYDCHMLYRLVSHKFEQQMWSALFGGGVKTVLKVANSSLPHRGDDLSKQRMKLNMRVMGSGGAKEKKTYKETFVPPELSMITFFMTKPFTSLDGGFSYDSEESLSSEEEEDEDSDFETTRPNTLPLSAVQQHVDPTSYAWCLIRFTVIKMVLHNLRTFLPQVGIELPELPVCSPLMHAVLKTLEQWMEVLQGKLDLFSGPPDEFISGLQFDVVTGIPISKYHALLNPSNTPFIDSHSTLPIKRLWFHLIKQEPLKEIFIRYIFRRQRQQTDSSRESSTNLDSTDGAMKFKDPMKVIHKEQDIITAFALNQANTNCLSLSTQKEIVELDIGPLLNPPTWLEDENEMDIEYIKNPTPASAMDSSDFFVVQTPVDSMQSAVSSSASSPMTGMSTPNHSSYQTGRSTSVILRRPVAGVRRIGSHPTLPHYLTGSADGSVRLYEWGHIQPLAMLRQPGAFPKVTKVLFSSQGNKCCVSDTEGDICLWQVGMGSNFNKPIMSLKCHNKTTSDFTFVGSSSLIATAGHSSESKNVCLWDMLLPPRSACIHAFTCHEHGCPALAYAPHHQLLITGGRKGEVCIFDIRQRQLRHTFQAHDVPIRCLAMDPEEEYFVTGSSEGDIKVWGLDIHQLVVNFPGEHNKTTFFQKMGSASGVTQVGIGPNHHLFSCGVDGSIKFRALPERESMVRYWTSDLK